MELLRSNTTEIEEQIERFDGSIFLNADREIHKVPLESILYIQGMGDYMKVICEEKNLIVHIKMQELQEILPKKDFFRLHKSYIISLNKIEKISKTHVLINEKFIPISRQTKKELLSHIPILN